jgi:hypothetical protein
MMFSQKLIVSLALVLFTIPASASSVYTINGSQQFSTVDVATGAFQQIGPTTPEGDFGLVAVYRTDRFTLAAPCGPTSANDVGGLDGKIYATDFHKNLYSVNPLTGAVTLDWSHRYSGDSLYSEPLNPDGAINFHDETILGAGGNLYSTFAAFIRLRLFRGFKHCGRSCALPD